MNKRAGCPLIYSRLTNKLGLAVVTAGPGSINVDNRLVGGYCDSAPMMVVSGQSALSFVKYQEESGIRQYGIQGIFIKPFVEKATKYFITIDDEKNSVFIWKRLTIWQLMVVQGLFGLMFL
jgi:thiamine pyrophosphate-dependent acetolactate synthase large subunit-like protein